MDIGEVIDILLLLGDNIVVMFASERIKENEETLNLYGLFVEDFIDTFDKLSEMRPRLGCFFFSCICTSIKGDARRVVRVSSSRTFKRPRYWHLLSNQYDGT